MQVKGDDKMQELEDKMAEIQDDIEAAKVTIAEGDSQISLMYQLINDDEQEIQKYNANIMSLDNDIILLEEEIQGTEEKLADTMAEEEDYYTRMKERIQVVYEYGTTAYLEVLLEAKTTSDFFNRLEYLTKLVEYDDSMLDKFNKIQQEITDFESKLNSEKLELNDIKEENAKNINEVQSNIDSKKETIDKIENDQEMARQNIDEWEKAQEELNEKIKEYIRLYSDSALLYGDGKLSHPTPGYTRISQKFGPRIHPVYGYKSFHTGIDLPAPYGTSIKAAASGIVIFAGWGTAYGNYILIDHGVNKDGNHIITQYAHCSSILVSVKDTIKRGDVIAKVGSTGWSTGNHLHFGVQVGGTWEDPENWLYEYN